MTGALILHADPNSADNLATKQYIDSAVSGAGSGVSTGNIIRKPVSTTPTGYLRCNGALVNKTTYANLYNVRGDAYSAHTTPGSGKPYKVQYYINLDQSAEALSFTEIQNALPDSIIFVTSFGNVTYTIKPQMQSLSSFSYQHYSHLYLLQLFYPLCLL